jgi:hypothetical protein
MIKKIMSWLRQLDAGFLPQNLGFTPWRLQMTRVVDNMTLELAFIQASAIFFS